jgi:hypothetical protein
MAEADSATVETALAQVVAAFGSGLGTLFISHAAARRGLDTFRVVVEKGVGEQKWDENLPALVAYSARIGRVTGQVTLRRGGGTVTLADFERALKLIYEVKSEDDPFGGCPFFYLHSH